MQITLTGGILLSLGLLVFLLKPKSLYGWMVFFIPFSATSIINIVKGTSGSGVQATMFFGALYLLVLGISSFYSGGFTFPRASRNAMASLILFLGVALLSLVMPLLLQGSMVLESPSLQKREFMDLSFSFMNITQYIYLVYGVLLVVAIVHWNNSEQALNQTLKIYILSGLFISLWGMMQFLMYKVGIPYPDQIFNNTINENGRGFYGVIDGVMDLKRISSVESEPSLFAKHLLTLLPILFFSKMGGKAILSSLWDWIALLILGIALLLSTSSTGYVGLAFMGLLSLVMLVVMREFKTRHYYTFIFLLVGIAVLFVSSYYLQDLLDQLIWNKSTSYSGLERSRTVNLAWSYFLKSPVLGLGWGTVTSNDLVVNLLANTGVLGFLAFLLFLVVVLGKAMKKILILRLQEKPGPLKYLVTGVFVSVITEIFTSILTGFPYTYSNLWFVVGLLMAITALIEKEEKDSNGEKERGTHESPSGYRVLSPGSVRRRRLHR